MVTNISFVLFSGTLVFYALFNIRGERTPLRAPGGGCAAGGAGGWGTGKAGASGRGRDPEISGGLEGLEFPGDSGDSGESGFSGYPDPDIPESSGEGLLALFF
jgi:hypothetical protein